MKLSPCRGTNSASAAFQLQVHSFAKGGAHRHPGPNLHLLYVSTRVSCSPGNHIGNQLLQVHGFRMSLWAEHTGIMSPNFSFPADIDCVREMRQIGTINWNVRGKPPPPPTAPLLAP